MVTNKIVWVNNLKGLAILAVVVGHMATPLTNFIYGWHIPLFIFLSGVLLRFDRNLEESVKHNFKKLIIPFILFGCLGLVAEYIKRWLWPGFGFVNENINLKDELLGIFWWMDFQHLHHYGFVLWFLPALFWAKYFYRLLLMIFKNKMVVVLVAMIFSVYGSKLLPPLPFGINSGVLGVLWLSLGTIITGRYWWLSLVALFLLRVPNTNLAVGMLDIYGFIYGVVFINFVVGLFKFGEKKMIGLSKFGERSMEILIFHPYLNNAVYFLIIYLLKYNWSVGVVVVISSLALILFLYEKFRKI